MNHFVFMLSAPLLGMVILVAGILLSRNPNQSLRSALVESVVWGGFSFLAFSGEILVLVNLDGTRIFPAA